MIDGHAWITRFMIGPAWAVWEGSPYLRHYRRLKRTQFDSRQATEDRQWQAILRMVQHAWETVPFYRERWAREGIDPFRLTGPDDLTRLPILTKADIRANRTELMSEAYRGRADLHRKKTSGSTGVSLEIWVDEDATQFKRGCTLRSDEWSGWRFGEPVAMIWGNPDYLKRGWRGRLRNGVLDRARHLDTLKMDETMMARFADDLANRPASLIFGHAHSVYLFASFVRDYRPGTIRPRGIITSAMPLHNWQRAVIEEVFTCKVTNRYGCEELSLIACECERHDGLHVNSDDLYVELLREGESVKAEELGSVVVTDLSNRAMPLIRYKTGDMAVWAGRSCPCGREGMPLLAKVDGREADYVTTARGELVSGISLTENFAMLVPGIAQLQIVQEAVDRFTFRLVRGNDFGPASLVQLDHLVAERFGSGTSYNCEYLESIPQEPSGKYRFCISKVPNKYTELEQSKQKGVLHL